MPAAPTLDTTTLGDEVAMNAIAPTLRKLWSDESGKTRASLMNFAIYTEDPAGLQRNTAMMEEVTREHSCRALLIVNDATAATAPVRAWVTAHCQLHNGKKAVCCEQLSFLMQGGTADQVRNTVFANLDSDLPLVAWWQGELTSRLDERFLSEMDSLFVDSSQWKKPADSLKRLLEVRRRGAARFTLNDLAWMRSHFVRMALASACQSALVLNELRNVNRLEITHAAGHRMSALMMAAWVGTQLKASLGAGEALTLQTPSGETISVVIKESAGTCSLQTLTLKGPSLDITIRKDPSASFVRTTVTHPQYQRDDVQPADCDHDAELISEQLSRLGGTTRFYESLPLLQQMLAR